MYFPFIAYQPDQLTDEALRSRYNHQNNILAFVPSKGNKEGSTISQSDVQKLEVEKFLDDVRYGFFLFSASFIETINYLNSSSKNHICSGSDFSGRKRKCQ